MHSDWTVNDWLFSLENRHSQEIQLGLHRIKTVAERDNLHRPECKVITVAGTNGKGSTVSALEAIYKQAGYRVGTYTSPHLLVYNERIRVNGIPISDEELCQGFTFIEQLRGDIHLTYFETSTLVALWHFKRSMLDVIILEVGLGGRLDATNIVDNDLAIITTIDFDHQEFLGDTLEKIGYEKAGIIRHGKTVIYADENPPQSILDVANQFEAITLVCNRDYQISEDGINWSLVSLDFEFTHLPKPRIQLKSAAVAIVATNALQRSLPVETKSIAEAMTSLAVPGRLQFIKGDVCFLYDVSHNAQSVRLLADTLRQMQWPHKVHAVFSALKDKDLPALIFPLRDCVDHWYPAQLDNKRAASAESLLSVFTQAEIYIKSCYNDPIAAFEFALSQAAKGDLIVVYGSFYTVSQIMISQTEFMG